LIEKRGGGTDRKGKKEKARRIAATGRITTSATRRDLQAGSNVIERRAQAGANGARRSDDRNRDEGGDQAVFDGRRAGIVSRQTLQKLHHLLLAPSECARSSDGKVLMRLCQSLKFEQLAGGRKFDAGAAARPGMSRRGRRG
jgi:hypothetical protein